MDEKKPDEVELSGPDMQRKREVFRLLDNMAPDASFDTVCSWIRRRLQWYEEHFSVLAAEVSRAEMTSDDAAAEAEKEREALRRKAAAESHKRLP